MIGHLSTRGISSCTARSCRSICVPTQRSVSSRRTVAPARYQPQPGDKQPEPVLEVPIVTPIAEVLVGTVQKTAASMKQDAEALLGSVSDTAEDIKENAVQAADKVESNAAQTADDLKQKARNAGESARESSSIQHDLIRDVDSQTRENINKYRDAANQGAVDSQNQMTDAQRGFLTSTSTPSSTAPYKMTGAGGEMSRGVDNAGPEMKTGIDSAADSGRFSSVLPASQQTTNVGRDIADADRDVRRSVSKGVDDVKDESASLADKASETWQDVKDAGKVVGQSMKRSVVATADAASDTASEAKDVAKDVGSDIKTDAKAAGRDIGNKIDAGLDRAADRVDSATTTGAIDPSVEGRTFESILGKTEDDAKAAADKASNKAEKKMKKAERNVQRGIDSL